METNYRFNAYLWLKNNVEKEKKPAILADELKEWVEGANGTEVKHEIIIGKEEFYYVVDQAGNQKEVNLEVCVEVK